MDGTGGSTKSRKNSTHSEETKPVTDKNIAVAPVEDPSYVAWNHRDSCPMSRRVRGVDVHRRTLRHTPLGPCSGCEAPRPRTRDVRHTHRRPRGPLTPDDPSRLDEPPKGREPRRVGRRGEGWMRKETFSLTFHATTCALHPVWLLTRTLPGPPLC